MVSLIISARTPYLLLTAPGTDYTGPSILASVAEIIQKNIEPAGHAHLRLQIQRLRAASSASSGGKNGLQINKAKNTNTNDTNDDNDDTDNPVTSEEKKRMLLLMDSGNHYEILGLGSLNINASDEQIKKAYRKLVLRYHPDKGNNAPNTPGTGTTPNSNTVKSSSSSSSSTSTPGGSTDEKTDPLFLAIRKAYEILSDEDKRRAYDSQFEFDDSIPTGNEKGDFYSIYGPVFERNGRFSENKPVPKLGSDNDSDEKVTNFYKFWFNFESWRDFSSLGEHDLNKAEYRDEKRWMERQNKNAITKAKKLENARVQDLVNRAYARDPRVIAMKAREEEEKQRIRDEKAAAKAAIENAKRKAEEEAAAKAAAEAEQVKAVQLAAKTAKEQEKKLFKRFRVAFKRLINPSSSEESAANNSSSLSTEITENDIEWLCSRLTIPKLYSVYTEVFGEEAMNAFKTQFDRTDGSTPVGTPVVSSPLPSTAITTNGSITALVAAVQREKEAERSEMTAREQELKTSTSSPIVIGKKEEIEWTPQELSMLAKAMARFPGGTRNRWLAVANVVNGLGQLVPRTQEDCIAKAHKIEEEKKKLNSQVFNIAMTSRRAEVELRDRDAQPTTVAVKSIIGPDGSMIIVPTVSSDTTETIPVPSTTGTTTVAPPTVPSSSSSTTTPKPTKAVTAPVVATVATSSSTSTPSTPVTDGTADSEAGVWTPEQQTALEAALKKYPSTLDKNERWKLIAEAVPGKSKKQCVARFKDIREKVKATVGGNT